MDNIAFAFLIVILIVLYWLCFYNPPHECMYSSPPNLSTYLGPPNQLEWGDMSRGLNYANVYGYTPVMRMLSKMEKSQGPEIQTDNRDIDEDPW